MKGNTQMADFTGFRYFKRYILTKFGFVIDQRFIRKLPIWRGTKAKVKNEQYIAED